MPRIIDLVRERKQSIQNDLTHAESARTGSLSIAAITAGIGSTDWKNYMLQFGELTALSPEQLSRLLAQDGTLGNPDLDKRRAYLVSNGVCGIQSPDTIGLDGKVNTIDEGLAGGCEP
jgi:hypothetical protein